MTVVITQDQSVGPKPSVLPISPSDILKCLRPSKNTLQNLHITPWAWDHHHAGVPDALRAALLRKVGDFPALKQLALNFSTLDANWVQRGDSTQFLVELLAGLGSLEGVLLHDIPRGISRAALQALAAAVAGMEWPRLRCMALSTGKQPTPERQAAADYRLASTLKDPELASALRTMRTAGVKLVVFPSTRAMPWFAEYPVGFVAPWGSLGQHGH